MVESRHKPIIFGGLLKTIFRSALSAVTCASLIAISLMTPAGGAVADTNKPELTEGQCSNVTVLGLGGTDSEEKFVAPDEPVHDFGFVNKKIYGHLDAALPEWMTSKAFPVPYEETKMKELPTPQDGTKGVEAFRNEISTATNVVAEAVYKAVEQCPDTTVVLMGYKQGAQIVHEASSLLPESVVKRSIGSIILVGDPLFDPKDPSHPKSQQYFEKEDITAEFGGMWIDPVVQGPDTGPVQTQDLMAKMAPANSSFSPEIGKRVINICNTPDYSCHPSTGFTSVSPVKAYLADSLITAPAKKAAEMTRWLCKDITFFAARGSGEPKESGNPTNGDYFVNTSKDGDRGLPIVPTTSDIKAGFGETLSSLAFAVETKFRVKEKPPTFGYLAIDYEAVSVPIAIGDPARYPKSVQGGIAAEGGPTQLRELLQKCPSTKIVAMGYSQGGHVIHELMLRLTPDERAQVKATVLVADAIRNPADKAPLNFMGTPLRFEMNNSKIHQGIGAMRAVANLQRGCFVQERLNEKIGNASFLLPVMPGNLPLCILLPSSPSYTDITSPVKFPDDMNRRVLSVCALKDVVCDTQLSLNPNTEYGAIWETGSMVDTVHGEGYKNSNFYDFPAAWAYARIGNIS